MNQKLKAVAEQAADNLRRFVQESEEEILKAWDAATEEAQIHETKPVLKLGFTIALDLEKDQMETQLAFSVRYKISASDAIPDPNQERLPLLNRDGDTVPKNAREGLRKMTAARNGGGK